MILNAHQNHTASKNLNPTKTNAALKAMLVVVAGSFLTLVPAGCGKGTSALPSQSSKPTPMPVPVPNIVVAPSSPTVQVGGTDAFSITQGGTIAGAQWVVVGGTVNGTIDSTGLYHAPSAVPSPSTITAGYMLASGSTFTAEVTIVGAPLAIATVAPSMLTSLSTPVEVTGSGFASGAAIVMDGVAIATSYIDASHLSGTLVLTSPLSHTHQVAVMNPDGTLSATTSVQATFAGLQVQPAVLTPGTVNLVITGAGFASGEVVTMGGNSLATTVISPTEVHATGYLAPWQTGSVVVAVVQGAQGAVPQASNGAASGLGSQTVPIATTSVSYDAAARFTTQAAFGPRPGLVEHIQQIGFANYITEQWQQQPMAYAYDYKHNQYNARHDYLIDVAQGNTLLRPRVAYALGTFLVSQWRDFDPSSIYIEQKLEADASGNYRQLLTDVASSPNFGYFLNLSNDFASPQPNQNFARELMQLFTIGPVLLNDDGSVQTDPNGNPIPSYDQDTVLAITRGLTGWTYPTPVDPKATAWGVDYSQPLTGYEAGHDHGTKTLFGTTLAAGSSVAEDRDAILDILFNHPNLPPFVSYRLIQHLVKSNPSPGYIERVSKVFENNGKGVRGDMDAIVRAILLDPEARGGDTSSSSNDGFLQDPLLFQLFAMNILQIATGDGQIVDFTNPLGMNLWNPATVFGYLSPTNVVPGTTIVSPEFAALNQITVLDRSSMLWGVVNHSYPGYTADFEPGSWLFNTFRTVPSMVEALNHIAYHGTMSEDAKNIIISSATQVSASDPQLPLQAAVFLALNADSYTVTH